jgi:hypothetical protein
MEYGYPPVSVTEFIKDPYKLYYINASHFYDKFSQSPMDTVTNQTVLKAFLELKFNAVVMEMTGQPRHLTSRYIAGAENKSMQVPPRCNEMELTIMLARGKNLPFVNAECPDNEIFAKLHTYGYSLKELQAFWILSHFEQFWRHSLFAETFDSNIFKLAASFASARGYPQKEWLSAQEYKTWFFKHHPDRKIPWDAREGDALSERPEHATAVQLLANKYADLRDKYAIGSIVGVLQEHKSVLVVYGAHHFHAHKPVFDALLTPGKERIALPAHPRTSGSRVSDRLGYRNTLPPQYKPLTIQHVLG